MLAAPFNTSSGQFSLSHTEKDSNLGDGMSCVIVGVAFRSGACVTAGECGGVGVGALPLALPVHPVIAIKVTILAKASAISLGRIMESPLWSPQIG